MLVLVLVLQIINFAVTSKILGLFPHPGISHFNVFKPIVLELARLGHEVEVASYFPNDTPVENYKDLIFQGQTILTGSTDLKKFAKKKILDYFTTFFELKWRGEEYCKTALNSPAIDDIFNSHAKKPFELVITEFYNSDCMLGLAYLLNVPVIGITSCTMSPWHYARISMEANMRGVSFQDRFPTWWKQKIVCLLYRLVQRKDNELLAKRFGADRIPDVREIARNTSLILVNQHYSLTGAREMPHQFVEIGGVHLRDPLQPLSSNLSNILANSNGVAYISWGSKMRVSTMPAVKRIAIIKACRQSNLTVLWKWDDDGSKMENQTENVHARPWLPQQEILCHDKVKVFFSHGGMLGVLEAVHCGVPIVVTPLYRDQFINAAAVEERKIGVVLSYETLNIERTFEALQRAIAPEIYENAQKVSHAFKNRLNRPLKLAIWNIENVIAGKGADLMKPGPAKVLSINSVEIAVLNLGIFVVLLWLIFKRV